MTHRHTRFILGLGLPALALAAATACNQPPTAPVLEITPAAPTTVDDLVATATTEASDPNDDNLIVTYEWTMLAANAPSDAVPEVVEGLVGDTVPAARTQKGQQWFVKVTVSDGEEVVSTEESVGPATILNTLPEVTSVRITPTSGVDTFGTLTATASGTDIDEDPVEIDLTWYVNGTAIEVEGDVLTGDYFGKNDEVHAEATVSDGEGVAEPVASSVVTILNTAPKIDGVVISPEEIREESEVRCDPVGWYDADEDTPMVETTWLVNGVEVSTDVVLTGEHFGKDDLIRCIGTATDGDDVGNTVVADVVTVLNTPPTLGSVSLSDTGPQAADTMTIVPNDAVDVDGDDLTYKVEWYVDDTMVAEGDELPPRSFIKTQEIYAMVTPFDGLEYGEPVKSEVATAVNTPPSLTEVTLAPTMMYTDSVAFPSVVAEDLDGDPITYTRSWAVNGTAVAATTAVLDGADWFDKDDTVSVTITPNDGEDDGTALTSDVVTVLNSSPTVPVIALDPEKPKSDDDLWVIVEEASTDADEDDLEYTFSWTRNGSEFTDTDSLEYDGDYVYTDNTADKDAWTCTVEVTDGTDTVSASLEWDVLDWEGQRDFTTCGKTGYLGPTATNCSSEYSGTNLEGTITIDNGWQEWEVPQDGTYRIEAFGAQGGQGTTTFGSNGGANGARVRGDFTLSEGEVLRILVGQTGQANGSYSAGGGGGTFVLKEDGTFLLAAGGGGGNGYRYYSAASCAGQATNRYGRITSTWTSGTCYTSTGSGYGGSYFYRSSGTLYYYGSGGAGYRGNGGYNSASVYSGAERINSTSNAGRGANGRYSDGGFGGGGAGGYAYKYSWSSFTYSSSFYGNGGGGGYSGGYGGYYRGGGGGSYNGGSNQVNSTGVRTGDGLVTLDLAP